MVITNHFHDAIDKIVDEVDDLFSVKGKECDDEPIPEGGNFD